MLNFIRWRNDFENQVHGLICQLLTIKHYTWQIYEQAHLAHVAWTAQLEVKYSGNPSQHKQIDYEQQSKAKNTATLELTKHF